MRHVSRSGAERRRNHITDLQGGSACPKIPHPSGGQDGGETAAIILAYRRPLDPNIVLADQRRIGRVRLQTHRKIARAFNEAVCRS